MQVEDFTAQSPGRCVSTIEGALAFVPNRLPPSINWTSELVHALAKAERAVGQLKGAGQGVVNPHLLIRSFIRREAVLSSQIEGTTAGFSDLLLFEVNPSTEEDVPDVREVHNYVVALEYGLAELKRRPLTLNLIREMHERLMEGVRGQERSPGEFRRIQNWIGTGHSRIKQARYVPPPPMENLHRCLNEFENYINTADDVPDLVRIALIHYQFEAIHPFIDGNGRIGRLIIALLLCRDGLLTQPLLYLSAYFEAHRREYYDHLMSISTQGTWGEWITFFLEGVHEQADDAVERSSHLLALREQYRRAVQQSGNAPARLLQLVDHLFASPVIKVADVTREMKVTARTALAYVDKLVELKVLGEISGRKRDRLFAASQIIDTIERRSAEQI